MSVFHRAFRTWPRLTAVFLLSFAAVGACDSGAEGDPSLGGGGSGANGPAEDRTGGAGGDSQSLPLPIDDIADCDSEVSFEGVTGYWYAYNATCEGMTGEQTPAPECAGEVPFEMEAVGTDCRARTTGGGFPNSESEGWGYALIGIQFESTYDACRFGGIGLSTGGSSVRVKVTTPDTEGDSDHFGASVSEGTHELSWAELEQEGWGSPQEFDCSQVTGLIFQAANPVEFDFWIDDVTLLPAGSGVEPDGPSAAIPEGRAPGAFLGDFNNTYYWFLDEGTYDGALDTELVGADCSPIATVKQGFADDVCLEGSGRLMDGTIINLTGTCDCGYPCGDSGDATCFFLADAAEFPWGIGSADNPLEPLRSWAVNDLAFGTVVYSPEWDGLEIPAVDGLGGFTHDGCFRVDDVGYSFGGSQADVFAGTESMFNALDGLIPTFSRFDVYAGADHCSAL